MVHSDWGDWLPRAVADADPDGLALWYLGCNGFVVKAHDGTTLFIDPYLGTGDPPRTIRMVPVPFDPEDVAAADAVLATHEHSDHVHGPSQAPILENTNATFYAPGDSLAVVEEEGWADEWALTDDQFAEVEPRDTLELGALEITVTRANDPDATYPVGYAIECDGTTFYHGGDARPGEAFEAVADRFDVDLCALAFGSVGMIPDKETREPKRTRWYNDENGVVRAAKQLEADRLLPTHWDFWKGLTADPTALHEHVRTHDYPRGLEIVEIGDRVDL